MNWVALITNEGGHAPPSPRACLTLTRHWDRGSYRLPGISQTTEDNEKLHLSRERRQAWLTKINR